MANDSMVAKAVDSNKAENGVDIETVLAFLRKKGLKSTEEILKGELQGSSGGGGASNSTTSTTVPGRMQLQHDLCMELTFLFSRSTELWPVYSSRRRWRGFFSSLLI